MKNHKTIFLLYIAAIVSSILSVVLYWCPLSDARIKNIILKPGKNMIRAELLYDSELTKVRAVMVLCPRYNDNGIEFLHDVKWREFAKKHRLGLISLSFASNEEDLINGKGYYYVYRESGEIFLEGIRKIYGWDLPLFLYGFSGGAHFTARMAEWKPDRIKAWCAYAAGWWDHPQGAVAGPPGIIACGKTDYRYQKSLKYFRQGIVLKRPWLWIGLNCDHVMNLQLEEFSRRYFGAVLTNAEGVWLNLDEKRILSIDESPEDSSEMTGWLPSADLLAEWQELIKL